MKKLLTMLLATSMSFYAFGGVVYVEESVDGDGDGQIHFQAELESASRLYLSSTAIGGSADLATARSASTSLLDTVGIDSVIELGKYSQAKSTASGITACSEMESTDNTIVVSAIAVSDDGNFADNGSTASCSRQDEGTGQRLTFSVPLGFVMENSGNTAKILLENVSTATVAGDGTSAMFDNVKVISDSNSGLAQDLMPGSQISLIQDLADDLFAYGDSGEMIFSMELDLEPGEVKADVVASDITITVEAQ